MFWKKKKPEVALDQLLARQIAEANASGDQRTELTYRLLLVSQQTDIIRVAMQSIVDNYSDGLSDLTHEACHLFPIPLAAEIERLERLVADNFEEIEGLADSAGDLLIKLAPLQVAAFKS
ncbi:hypothetical protein [Pseudomonas helleri]|uniref:hypothetical protein n=1 Tax=Pseudomonas helleri TaxID=1608996 RepID=UPI0012970F16|nr:hypothetical protein [Pseudomonas helleri]MQT98138.1 hypothetical protein [Pseudomonas helleri]